MYQRFIKRLLDLFAVFCILIPAGLLILIIGGILYFSNRGAGVIFSQNRPGKNGKIFRLFKFKTMTDERDSTGKLLPDSERITRVGKFVRKTSLDELPQIFNILNGDMSIVGPRPLLPEYLPLYTAEQAHRHDVRPGVTGWAQVNGRNAISWDEKFKLDVWYVQNLSFAIDMKILFLTFLKVIKSDGIDHGDGTTMPPFTGNNSQQ